MLKTYTLRIMLTLVVGLIVGWAVAQDSAPDEPLSDEETLALLADTGVQVYSLDVVTASPVTIHDLSATSARVNWVGTIPIGCLLLFGETTDFGSATIDPNMGEPVTIDHNPVMTGLQPETQYYYRLQGSDAAGNFYVSEIYTFTTPAQSDTVSDNLLSPTRGAEIIAVSSNWNNQPNEGSTWGVVNAFDDDPNTAWSSNGDGNDAFVEVRLGQRTQIDTIAFWTRTMSNDTAQVYSFTVTTDSGEVFGPFELPDPDQPYEFAVDFEAETLRFDVVDSNGGNTGAVEIAAYGTAID